MNALSPFDLKYPDKVPISAWLKGAMKGYRPDDDPNGARGMRLADMWYAEVRAFLEATPPGEIRRLGLV
jgi:hypothetical protein